MKVEYCVPLALSEVEMRFSAGFPGVIARFDNGGQAVTLRHVRHPTRKLHPVANCFRALGYKIDQINLEQRTGGDKNTLQRCFTARQDGAALRVYEYIEDGKGQRFIDTSAWYWAALMGKTSGLWQSVTLARPV